MANRPQSLSDAQIIAAARAVYESAAFDEIRSAHQAGQSITLSVSGWSIQYEPLQFSGMTAFSENGFIIGKEAFASEDELKKTQLHELYRLGRSALSHGRHIDRASASAETRAAFEFAERHYQSI